MCVEAERGFTLVEVLVALVMAALLSAILLSGATQARARLAHAEEQRKAVFLARTLLARGLSQPYDPADQSGTTNGLNWSLAQRLLMADPRGQYGLVGLHVAIANERGQTLFAGDARRLKRMPAP